MSAARCSRAATRAAGTRRAWRHSWATGETLGAHLHRCRVAWRAPLVLALHHGHKSVRRRLWTDANAGEVAFEEVADERRLAHGVLAEQQHHRLRIKVPVVQERR